MAQYWSVEECGWVESPVRAVRDAVPEQSGVPQQEQLPDPAGDAPRGAQTTMRMT